MNTVNNTFDPQTLAGDLLEVRRVYTEFFASINESNWDKSIKGSPKEWNLHETVAHPCALNGDGLESIKHTLRGDLRLFLHMSDLFSMDARPKVADKNLMIIVATAITLLTGSKQPSHTEEKQVQE